MDGEWADYGTEFGRVMHFQQQNSMLGTQTRI